MSHSSKTFDSEGNAEAILRATHPPTRSAIAGVAVNLEINGPEMYRARIAV